LEDKFLSLDGDRVSGIVAAGIACYYTEPLRENVNDFAFAFVAPLRADDDRRLASFQLAAPLCGRAQRQAPMLSDRSDFHTTRQ
jgi:hypothetical protein